MMRQVKDTRSPEFVAPIKAIPTKLKMVKRLKAYGTNSDGLKLSLGFVAPRSVVLRGTDARGKEVLYYQTDGRTTLHRLPGQSSVRGKYGSLPAGMPKLMAILLGKYNLADFGVPGPEDLPREYEVRRKNWEKRPVLALSYHGSDSIGRSQNGELLIDQLTGLPVSFEERQLGNSPRDDGDYAVWEKWPTVQVK